MTTLILGLIVLVLIGIVLYLKRIEDKLFMANSRLDDIVEHTAKYFLNKDE